MLPNARKRKNNFALNEINYIYTMLGYLRKYLLELQQFLQQSTR